MTGKIEGGFASYGHLAGILMSDSVIPRIPGDPGHAETFNFPVIHQALKGFPFEDLIEAKKDHIDILKDHAKRLQQKGVRFIAADCGLFGPFQEDLSRCLDVPFIGSALDLVPMLKRHFPENLKIGILTGDANILRPVHLSASGIDPESVLIQGMQDCDEFRRVVIERGTTLDLERMKQGVMKAAAKFDPEITGAVVLECTNLISFRPHIQKLLQKPVFDLVTLMEFYAFGFLKRHFHSNFL